MAPERLTDHEKVDARSDIYSLGAVAYHLVSARPIHRHNGDLDLLYKVVNSEPVHIASTAKQAVPAELAELVMTCLAKEPEARPQSVYEICERLESVPGLLSWTQADATKWWQKNVPSHQT
jgi:serine/threonine-protein kinase